MVHGPKVRVKEGVESPGPGSIGTSPREGAGVGVEAAGVEEGEAVGEEEGVSEAEGTGVSVGSVEAQHNNSMPAHTSHRSAFIAFVTIQLPFQMRCFE